MFFGDQIENWLEEVGVEAQVLVDALQEALCGAVSKRS